MSVKISVEEGEIKLCLYTATRRAYPLARAGRMRQQGNLHFLMQKITPILVGFFIFEGFHCVAEFDLVLQN